MSLLKRLGYYIIGLAIGLVLLTFFLKQKRAEFCYLPNCRVLKELRSKPLELSDSVKEEMKRIQIDSTDLKEFFTNGDVDFSSSDTKAKPCKTYLVEADIREENLVLRVKSCDSLLTAEELKIAD